MLKSVRSAFWRIILGNASIRKRLGFQLKHYYPNDLDLRIPLGGGVVTPAFDDEIGSSFSEIFLQNEYSPLLEHIPLPNRWLDLGCYAGFFSLWLMWKHRETDSSDRFRALLVDADSQKALWVRRVLEINDVKEQMEFRLGAIAPGEGSCTFVERTYMGSSLEKNAEILDEGKTVEVPILTQQALLTSFPGPYDLLKVDMEGAEYYLLTEYPQIVQQSRFVVLEWHSWHPGGGGAAQAEELLSGLGFTKVAEIQPVRSVSAGETGVFLYRNEKDPLVK